MSISSDRARLSQKKQLEQLRCELRATDMVPVYLKGENGSDGIYSVLVPSARISDALSDPYWDFTPEDSVPFVDVVYEGGNKRAEYFRHGMIYGIEPLVINRSFSGLRNGYMEVCEEFRLFHNLYHDSKKNEYIKFDDAGDEDTVIDVESNCIRIRLKELRQFLAIKEMYLSIQFGRVEHSEHSLKELGLNESGSDHREGLTFWRLVYGGGNRAFSRIVGKRLIEPLPKSASGFREFADKSEQRYVEFVIGIDERGNEIAYSCNPDSLANFFGANPEAPNYLTPVHFRKQVLDNYYQKPSKYTVGDSFLCCGDLWFLDIDNHHEDRVCVWLGRIGDNLPYKEQLHWRMYNIVPAGGISEIYFQRQFQLRPMNTDQPDLLFKRRYHDLREASHNYLGWQILHPLHSDDEHHFQALRIPATDEQQDFDNLVLSLTKLLIDSMHVKRLNSLLSEEQKEGVGKSSIDRLEAVLAARNVQGAAEHIAFLRNLQNLRSSSSAHRKGSKYEKTVKRFGIEKQNLRDVFAGILRQALDFLSFLIILVRSGRFDHVDSNRIEEGYAILKGIVGFVDSGASDGSVNHDDLIYELRSRP